MEERIAFVVGAFAVPPAIAAGTGWDGVVQLTNVNGGCTGSLLTTGRHILTAAHCITNGAGVIDAPNTTVNFQMPGRTIQMTVPQANYYLYQPWNGTTTSGNDLALLLLPALAPSGPVGLGAERYDIYRDGNEIGQNFTFVGYGLSGTGNTGTNLPSGTKRQGQNRYEALGQVVGGPANTSLAYDFDNGNSANDALGANHSIPNLGLGAVEANTAPGDSGGPSFIGGRIAAITSYGYGYAGSPDVLPGTNSSFGEISVDTRISSFAWWIDYVTSGRHDLTIDMQNQIVGNDAAPDTVELRKNGVFLDVIVNNQLYHRDLWSDVGTLRFSGSSANDTFIVPADLGGNYPLIIDGRGGSNQLVVYSRNNSRTYTVTSTYVDITGNPLTSLRYSNMSQLTIGAGASDTVNVWSTAANTPVTIREAGTVNIGPQGQLASIQGTVTIDNPPNYTALTIDNSADTIRRNNVVLSNGGISGLAGANIQWTENDLRSLTVRGSNQGSTFIVLDSPQSSVLGGLTTTILGGSSGDQVFVRGTTGNLQYDGRGGIDSFEVFDPIAGLQHIGGTVGLQNNGGQTVLHVNDTLNTSGRNAVAMYPGAGWNILRGLAPADITHRLSQTAEVNISLGTGDDTFTFDNTDTSGLNLTTLNSGGGSDTVHIRAITGPLTINAGLGDDTVNLQAVAPGNGVTRLLTFNASDGIDTLQVLDQTQIVAQTYDLFATALRRGDVDINMSLVDNMRVYAGSNQDGFVIVSQANDQNVELFGGLGNDTFYTGSLTADGVRGPVRFDGEGGNDNRIIIRDIIDTTGDTVHIDQNTIGAVPGDNLFGPGGSLTFTSVQQIDLTCGSGTDIVYVQPNLEARINIDLGPQSQVQESGDELRLALADVSNYILTPGAAGEGIVTSDNRQTLTFVNAESVSVDDQAPTVLASSYADSPVPYVRFEMSEDVSPSIIASSLILTNLSTAAVIPTESVSVTYDPLNFVAEFTFPGFINGILPAGEYEATLAGSVVDTFGNQVADFPALFFRPAGTWGTFIVNSTADDGDGVCDANECTLREAMTAANEVPNIDGSTPDQIVFELLGDGPYSIQPVLPLPEITDPVVIDGASQVGFGGAPIIEIDGSLLTDAYGLVISSGSTTVRGLAINRFASLLGPTAAIGLFGFGNNVLEGNFLGTNVTGDSAFPIESQSTFGVVVFGSDNNRIGTNGDDINDELERNVISGSVSSGILVQTASSNNIIAGNRIGVSADGTTAINNGRFGIFFLGAGDGNRIGTNADGTSDSHEANTISANPEAGIRIDSSYNVVSGNLIGTDASGTISLPNGSGVLVEFGNNNQIGGIESAAANIIAFNTNHGVGIDGGTGNTVRGNSIFQNTGLAINLADAADPESGVTANDQGDGDEGSNTLLNTAELNSITVSNGNTTIVGTYDGLPNATFQIELFVNNVCHASGYGDGQTLVSDLSLVTDEAGHADFTWILNGTDLSDVFVTSTATDEFGNTSEFSACQVSIVDSVARWISPEDGLWTDPNNWENGHIPVPGDDVVIDLPEADVTVVVPSGSYSVARLIGREQLVFLGAELLLSDTSEFLHIQLDSGSRISQSLGTLTVNDAEVFGDFELSEGVNLQLLGNVYFGTESAVAGLGTVYVDSSANLHIDHDSAMSLLEIGAGGRVELAGTLLSDRGITILAGGLLAGTGTIQGNVNNSGTIAPGTSAGILIVEGNYSQTFDGSLQIEVSGLNAGEFDTLEISGSATFDGMLSVQAIGSYVLSPGDELVAITYASRDGIFAEVVGTSVAAYGDNAITLYPTGQRSSDFDLNGILDGDDLDGLIAEIAAATHSTPFDLNQDGAVTLADRDTWLAEAGAVNLVSDNPYHLGDANLDGVVDGSDFGRWNANKFTAVAAWTKGDFNADGFVDGSDFGIWNSNKFTASRPISQRKQAPSVFSQEHKLNASLNNV